MLFLLLAFTAHAVTLNMGAGYYKEGTCTTPMENADCAGMVPCTKIFADSGVAIGGVVCTKTGASDCVATATVDTSNAASAALRDGDACDAALFTGACTQMVDGTGPIDAQFKKMTCEVKPACTDGEAGCKTCLDDGSACKDCETTHTKNAENTCDLAACTDGQAGCKTCKTDRSACDECETTHTKNAENTCDPACTDATDGCKTCLDDGSACKECEPIYRKNDCKTCDLAACTDAQAGCKTCKTDRSGCKVCEDTFTLNSETKACELTVVCEAGVKFCEACGTGDAIKECATCIADVAATEEAAGKSYTKGTGGLAGQCVESVDCKTGELNCKACGTGGDIKKCATCIDNAPPKFYTAVGGACILKEAVCSADTHNCKTCDSETTYKCKTCIDNVEADAAKCVAGKNYSVDKDGNQGECKEEVVKASSASALVFSFVGLLAMLF